jgi:hypothetical protein
VGSGAAPPPEMARRPRAVLITGGLGAVGRALQVEPMKAVLKAPGTKHLKLRYDEVHSKLAFN